MKKDCYITKKIIYLFVIFTICFGIKEIEVSALGDTSFSDLPKEHWAYEYVMQMVKEGAVNGYNDGTFAPDRPVTRAEFCKIVTMTTGKILPTIDEARNSYYSIQGIAGHWGELYMASMSKNTWSYDDWYLPDNVNPDQAINRGEAAMGIADIWYGYPRSYIGKETEIKEYLANKYKDAGGFGGLWGTVYEASIEGFMTGYEDGTFRCGDYITRAELCTILYRAFSKDLEDNLAEDDNEYIKLFDSIALTMDRDIYLLYRTANNRIQKINGTPYLSNTDLKVRMSTDFGDGIIEEVTGELYRTSSAWQRTFTENIIHFVQDDIEYLTDTDERDYAKFPYETLYDQGGDCEDKAILMCALLNEAGYNVCLIVFSDHVGVGVDMVNPVENGYYYNGNNGVKYYYLETTAPGWKIGELPSEYIYEGATLLYP